MQREEVLKMLSEAMELLKNERTVADFTLVTFSLVKLTFAAGMKQVMLISESSWKEKELYFDWI